MKKPRRLSEDRVEDAISDFQETLPSFCETMLSNGSRNGNEWQVPDLDNSPRHDGKPGSCSVNLETGRFYDHNPAAEPQKGGPVKLWGTLFGLNYQNKTDFIEIILGMEAWVKDGSLPDGRRGAVPSKIKTSKFEGVSLIPRDSYERDWLKNIQVRQEEIARARSGYVAVNRECADHVPVDFIPAYDGALNMISKDYPDDFLVYIDSEKGESLEDYLARGNNRQKALDRQVAYAEMLIRSAYSKIYAYRWLETVRETQKIKEKAAQFLAEYRGLGPDVFLWMIQNGYVALYTSLKSSPKSEQQWEDTEIAFPVSRDGNYSGRRPGFRITQDGKWPWQSGVFSFYREREGGLPEDLYKPDLEFLGMHLKWIGTNGKTGWRYEPKGNGCGSVPFIIGDITAADLVIIGESTWDMISFIDLYRLFERTPDRPWAAIDTCGASNAKRIPADRIKPGATILLLLQNDSNGANDHWCAGLPLTVRERGRRIIPPEGIKDLNDWMQAASAEEIKKILEHK